MLVGGRGDNPFMAGCQFQFTSGGFLKEEGMAEEGMKLSLIHRVMIKIAQSALLSK